MSNKSRNYQRKPDSNKKLRKILIIVDVALLIAIVACVFIFKNTLKKQVGNTFFPVDRDKTTKQSERFNSNQKYIDRNSGKEVSEGEYTFQEDNYNILFIGKDDIALNTDVMMLINFNTKKEQITIMQIPRDTFFTYNNTPVKFNSIYARMQPGNTEESKKAALEGFCKVVSENLAVHIDYYAMIDLNGVAELVDSIGGVEMYVPYDMKYNDPGQNLYINLKEGQQTLNGDQAKQYIRFRKGLIEADVGRQDAQKVFMVAFLNNFRAKYKDNMSISELVKKLQKLLINNIPENDCINFALIASAMENLEGIRMLSAPGQPQYYGKVSYFVINREAVYNIINNYFLLVDKNLSLPEEEFDKDRNFTLLSDATINGIYNSHIENLKEYTAQEITDDNYDIGILHY